MAIVNGKRVNPNSIDGCEWLSRGRLNAVRRPFMVMAGKPQLINPQSVFRSHDRVNQMLAGWERFVEKEAWSDRFAGGFGGMRSSESMQIIAEQVVDVAEHLFEQGVRFDEACGNWMIVRDYALPPQWHEIAEETSLMVVFPDEYPLLPPIGFYLLADLPELPDGQVFRSAFRSAWHEPIEDGWKWYGVHRSASAWRPARDWRRGDNLHTYFDLIEQALDLEEYSRLI